MDFAKVKGELLKRADQRLRSGKRADEDEDAVKDPADRLRAAAEQRVRSSKER